MVAILLRPTSPAPSVSLEITMVWPLTRSSFFMMSAILREKMSEPPPAEEVQVQVTVLVGTNSPSSPPWLLEELLPQAARDSIIMADSASAISFFMLVLLFSQKIFISNGNLKSWILDQTEAVFLLLALRSRPLTTGVRTRTRKMASSTSFKAESVKIAKLP